VSPWKDEVRIKKCGPGKRGKKGQKGYLPRLEAKKRLEVLTKILWKRLLLKACKKKKEKKKKKNTELLKGFDT